MLSVSRFTVNAKQIIVIANHINGMKITKSNKSTYFQYDDIEYKINQ